MDEVEKLVKELQQRHDFAWETYLDLHKEMDSFRGRMLDGAELVKVNEILAMIQEHFAHQLYPTFNFVLWRYDQAKNACQQYEEFILSLKQQGAKEEKHEKPKKSTH